MAKTEQSTNGAAAGAAGPASGAEAPRRKWLPGRPRGFTEKDEQRRARVRRERDRAARRRDPDPEVRLPAELEELPGVRDVCGPAATDARLLRLEEAYHLVVRKGRSLPAAAAAVGMPFSSLRWHAEQKGWLQARSEYQALVQEAQSTDDVLSRAEATKRLLLAQVERCRTRLEVMERAVQRKWVATVGDYEETTFVDAEGKKHTVRVPKAGPASLSALLDLQQKLMAQMQRLAQFSDARVVRDLRRIVRSRKGLERRVATEEAAIMARAPVATPNEAPEPEPGDGPPGDALMPDDLPPPEETLADLAAGDDPAAAAMAPEDEEEEGD